MMYPAAWSNRMSSLPDIGGKGETHEGLLVKMLAKNPAVKLAAVADYRPHADARARGANQMLADAIHDQEARSKFCVPYA